MEAQKGETFLLKVMGEGWSRGGLTEMEEMVRGGVT